MTENLFSRKNVTVAGSEADVPWSSTHEQREPRDRSAGSGLQS